ncbi:MAG: M48 family metallopeptidase, partial [Bdellovibrionales bacterium]
MRNGIICLLFPILAACSSTTKEGAVDADRRQLLLLPAGTIEKMSAQAYAETLEEARKKGALDQDPATVKRLTAIAQRLIPQTGIFREDAKAWEWDVHLISSPELNAYVMPGGKIIFYTGIIEKLKLTDAEIAAIMGHEIAHALREHGRERMSEALIQQIGLEVLVGTGKVSPKYAGALSLLSNLAINLPHSRGQESEADKIGLDLMARAGYNPESAVDLWQKMKAAGG